MKVQLPIVLTPTRAEAGSACHRKHVLSDILEWGKHKSPAAQFGNVIHAGAAAWWKWTTGFGEGHTAAAGDVPTVPYTAMMEAVRREWGVQEITSEKYTLEMAERMMEAYSSQASLAGVFEGVGKWQVLTIEERFEVVWKGIRMRFQNDRALAEVDSQRVLLVDTKTTSRPDAKWRKQWSQSLQMKLYRKAVLELYDRETDILVEGVDKGSKPKLHYVITPHWSEKQLEEAVEQFLRVGEADKELVERYLLPDGSFNLTGLENEALTKTAFNYGNCYSYGMECPFLPLCDAEPEDRRGMLHADYKQVVQDY
jgi:hypothetical protein